MCVWDDSGRATPCRPFSTGCLPLSDSGNPGVTASDRVGRSVHTSQDILADAKDHVQTRKVLLAQVTNYTPSSFLRYGC